jgi:hypothetical protein
MKKITNSSNPNTIGIYNPGFNSAKFKNKHRLVPGNLFCGPAVNTVHKTQYQMCNAAQRFRVHTVAHQPENFLPMSQMLSPERHPEHVHLAIRVKMPETMTYHQLLN